MAPTALARDVKALRDALRDGDSTVSVTLSREVAEFLAEAAEAEVDGRLVITRGFNEVTTAEAAVMLGMSRPQASKLINMGLLPSRLVGTHHRIAVADIDAYLARERARRREGLRQLAALQDDMGLDN
jgi:excisionase family DNA binding protein